MSKQILVIVSSPRRGGNSELLADRFIEGAQEAGHAVEKICLRERKLSPCLACYACMNNGGRCVQRDDMADILEKMAAADILVLTTPVYYCSVSAQIKIMIDRTLAASGRLKNKDFYLIATAADGKPVIDRAMDALQGFVDCVPNSQVVGKVYGTAFTAGEIQGKPAMDEAYRFGRDC